jgi:hypothetical protein
MSPQLAGSEQHYISLDVHVRCQGQIISKGTCIDLV